MSYAYIALGCLVACLLAWIAGGNNREQIVRGEYAQRDLAEANERNASYRAWNERERANEAAALARGTEIGRQLQVKKTERDNAKNAALAGVGNGTIVLRDFGAPSCTDRGGASSQAGAPGSGNDGEAGSKLSERLANYLIGEATRADKVVDQLTACQAQVLSDRQMP